ncbi:MAG: 3D domain-containing protein [Myxococcota bacterium]
MKRATRQLPFLLAAACLLVACERRADTAERHGSDAETTEARKDTSETQSNPTEKAEKPNSTSGEPEGPWLRITEPSPDSRVKNPVTFRFEASEVRSATLEIDGTPVTLQRFAPSRRDRVTDTVEPESAHIAELIGYDDDGDVIARSSVDFRIDPQRESELVGTFWNSYYYLPAEKNLYGGEPADIRTMDCDFIATVPMAFVHQTCLQGSGRLDPEGVVTLAGRCDCGVECPGSGKYCFTPLDPETHPWGAGPNLEPTTPLRTWAVDPDILPQGAVVFAEEWDGLWIPDIDGLGGFNHDGCFIAQDVGGSIHGDQVDIFVGARQMWQTLEGIFPTRSDITVYLDSPKCESSPAARLAR